MMDFIFFVISLSFFIAYKAPLTLFSLLIACLPFYLYYLRVYIVPGFRDFIIKRRSDPCHKLGIFVPNPIYDPIEKIAKRYNGSTYRIIKFSLSSVVNVFLLFLSYALVAPVLLFLIFDSTPERISANWLTPFTVDEFVCRKNISEESGYLVRVIGNPFSLKNSFALRSSDNVKGDRWPIDSHLSRVDSGSTDKFLNTVSFFTVSNASIADPIATLTLDTNQFEYAGSIFFCEKRIAFSQTFEPFVSENIINGQCRRENPMLCGR